VKFTGLRDDAGIFTQIAQQDISNHRHALVALGTCVIGVAQHHISMVHNLLSRALLVTDRKFRSIRIVCAAGKSENETDIAARTEVDLA
jgi:hypothetical protein